MHCVWFPNVTYGVSFMSQSLKKSCEDSELSGLEFIFSVVYVLPEVCLLGVGEDLVCLSCYF